MLTKAPLAALAAAALTVSPAHATTYDFTGGCPFATVNDTTPGGLLGGPRQWNGTIHLRAVVTDAAGIPAPVYAVAWCELRVDTVSQGTVLGPAFGVGVLADAGPFVFTAATTDVVMMCTHVVVGGTEKERCSVLVT